MGQYKRRVELQMTEEDYRLLVDKAERAGISKSEFVRRIIRGYVFPEKPDEEFMRLFYRLSQIGNDISGMSVKCKEDMVKTDFENEISDMNKLKDEIRKKYLSPWKS